LGTRIGRYEIVAPLGAGGMGDVYLANDVTLGRRVALKFLPAEVANDPDRLRRFEQEARAASALNHPNIVTIHETGEADGRRFIATEFVEGQTLRQRMRADVSIGEVLAIAEQVASALGAAHDAGIVHRDIKPENIMLRPDGYVKVVDFGLAKVADGGSAAPGDETRADVHTRAGVVMGTVAYMSPEQARGLPVDARGDFWSLGVVLYELVARRPPFGGATATDTLAAILTATPAPLGRVVPECPPELQRIILKLLRADREARYQAARDLLVDLKALRSELEFAAKAGGVGSAGAGVVLSARVVRSPRLDWRVGVAALAIVAIGVAAWVYFVAAGHRPSALTSRDAVLIADFDNPTGDAVFDGTLKQGLVMQLQQSPFLTVFPDASVRETLRQMQRPEDARITVAIGRDVAQRRDLKALIAGSIAALGSHYVITLRAITARTGDELASSQREAENKEQVLKALSAAATEMREHLGESLSSIHQSDVPLYQWTTSSLEALQSFARAFDRSNRGKYFESIPLFRHATELDPDFAYAYSILAGNYTIINEPGLAAANAAKAFARRDRVTEREKLYITGIYDYFTLGDLDQGIEQLGVYQRSYPDDFRPPGNLSLAYLWLGQFDKAIDAAQTSVRLNPNISAWQVTLGTALLRLNRYDEASGIFAGAVSHGLDDVRLHGGLYTTAAIRGDGAAMQQQVDWARGQPNEYAAIDWQTETLAASGRWRQAQEMSRQAIELATRPDARGLAARYAAEQALRAAVIGRCDQADASAAQSVALERNPVSLPRATLALALCGRSDRAQALVSEMAKQYDRNTLVNGLWLPTIRAALAVERGPAAAVDQLQPVLRYDAAGEFWPQYVRGLAFLRLRQGPDAAAEFQKIRDCRGQAPMSILYPLASLGLARAAGVGGDPAKGGPAYEEFLAAWKDADPDVPVLREARARRNP
jgi:tetratricopeptide (TPR) repeat protein